MSRINAMSRSVLQQGLSQLNRELTKEMTELTGANSDALKASATVLVKTWKRVVGGARGSAPGQPPGKRKGRLQRSIGTTVVEGVRRVGSSNPVARWTELGTSPVAGQGGMAPRPHGRIAIEIAAPQMTDAMVTELQRRGG